MAPKLLSRDEARRIAANIATCADWAGLIAAHRSSTIWMLSHLESGPVSDLAGNRLGPGRSPAPPASDGRDHPGTDAGAAAFSQWPTGVSPGWLVAPDPSGY